MLIDRAEVDRVGTKLSAQPRKGSLEVVQRVTAAREESGSASARRIERSRSPCGGVCMGDSKYIIEVAYPSLRHPLIQPARDQWPRERDSSSYAIARRTGSSSSTPRSSQSATVPCTAISSVSGSIRLSEFVMGGACRERKTTFILIKYGTDIGDDALVLIMVLRVVIFGRGVEIRIPGSIAWRLFVSVRRQPMAVSSSPSNTKRRTTHCVPVMFDLKKSRDCERRHENQDG